MVNAAQIAAFDDLLDHIQPHMHLRIEGDVASGLFGDLATRENSTIAKIANRIAAERGCIMRVNEATSEIEFTRVYAKK